MVLVDFICFVYWFVVCILRFAFVDLWWGVYCVILQLFDLLIICLPWWFWWLLLRRCLWFVVMLA